MATAPTAQGFIPQTDPYSVPKGLDPTTTPQGGSAFKDTAGTFGAAGSIYVKGANGYTLATSLPGNLATVKSGQGITQGASGALGTNNTDLVMPGNPGNVPVGPTGVTAKTAPATPTTPTAPVPPAVDANGQPVAPQKTAAQIQAETDALAAQPLASDTGTRTSAKIADTFQSYLDNLSTPLPAQPTSPSSATDQTNAENAVGVPAIQQNLSTLQDQMTKLQNDLQNRQAGEASKPGVVASIINGRMTMLSAQDSKALNDLKLQITEANTQLTQANAAVKTIMANSQTDYKNAEAQYQFDYTKALTAYHDEVAAGDKAQASAKANAQVIINSYKGSAAGFDAVTDTEKSQWGMLELQAGLPAGTIEAAVKAELNIQKFVKGSDGNMYVTGTDAQGVPFTAKVTGSYGAGTGTATGTTGGAGAWTKQQLNANTAKMSASLDAAKGADGFVSNADYAAAQSDWIQAGGTVASFTAAFKAYKTTRGTQ